MRSEPMSRERAAADWLLVRRRWCAAGGEVELRAGGVEGRGCGVRGGCGGGWGQGGIGGRGNMFHS